MMKINTVTFHRAHNFGSVLQAYALQHTVLKLCANKQIDCEYRIIDLYTDTQEELYQVFKRPNSLRSIIKNCIALRYSRQLKEKYRKFTGFIDKHFLLTQRYRNSKELRLNIPVADFYLSGSDQIWNVRAKDFSAAYYLDFVHGKKKVSYAASLGPLEIDWTKYDADGCRAALAEYSAVSVREQGSAENIAAISDAACQVHVDPTMLLKKEDWKEIQSDVNYNNGQYILLYCLEPSREQLRMADAVSKKLGLPIVVLRYNNKNDMINHFVKKYDAGPEDFLSYIDHAALVLSSSFHGTAFSLIYHKPFYCFHGMEDKRISDILKKTGMVDRSLECIEDIDCVSLEKPDEETIEKVLNEERRRSAKYLRKALEIDHD